MHFSTRFRNLGRFCVSVCPVSEQHPAHQRVQSLLPLWLSAWGTASCTTPMRMKIRRHWGPCWYHRRCADRNSAGLPVFFLALFNLLDLFVAAPPAGESSGQSLLAEWSSVPHGHGNALVLGEQGWLTWWWCQQQQGCFSGASGRLLEGASNIVCALRQHAGSRSATFGGSGHFAAGGSHCDSVDNVLF